jgi:hypothetical protein
MATEYVLSYKGIEIEEKLRKIDSLVQTVNGVAPDENGNVEVAVPEIHVMRLDNGDESGVTIFVDKTTADGDEISEYATVYDGKDGGVKTVNGIAPDENGNVQIQVSGGTVENGKDGFSPIATVTQTDTGAVITITDKDGTTTATITNGKDGVDGQDGKDGYTPQKGIDYFDGQPGKDGVDGSAGKDGTSVTVKSVSESTADGGSNVVTFSDGKTVTIKNGSKGSTGARGAAGTNGVDGYTPVKGTDYYTDEDKVEFEALIADEMAKKAQIKPEFAQTIDECTDTTKLYVLPDGYIYAYVYTEVSIGGYTNQIPKSINADGTPFNDGQGWQFGYRLNSSGAQVSQTDHAVTGFIKANVGDVVCFQDIYSTSVSSNTAILHYDDTFAHINPGVLLRGEDAQALLTAGEYTISDYYASCAYIRISATNISADSIITVNEEIKEGTTGKQYAWASTGHAFVPADYEDRIIELEEQSEQFEEHEVRLTTLESGGVAPAYVREEAERVADLVLDKRTAQSLVFAAASDFHYPYDDGSDGEANTSQSTIHAGMGIAEIRKYLPLDFIGLFGDYVKGASTSTVAESKAALKFIHKAMYEAGNGVQQIWMQGNHDRNPYDTDDGDLTDDELYSYIFANNIGCVVDSDNIQRGYGYKDFDAQKIRVIYWNSSDISGAETVTDHMFSAAQYQWMANVAFDLSGKEDASEWGIVMLSHMPVNWNEELTGFVDAYISGTSATITAADSERVTVNFSGKNDAEFICAVNGHTHNFRYSQIGSNRFWQIAVPQACAGRYNEYGTSWPEVGGELDVNGEPVYYYKTADSPTSTSFNVFVIDRKNRKIHAICYGAGIDREISY